MGEPRYRALLIGNAVFRRDPQGLPRLRGPRADVDALSEVLADPESGMFAVADIHTHIDRDLQGLREALHRFLIEDAARDDVLFLYYSGHGKLDLLGRLHLCAGDTRVNALPVTALRYKEDIDALIEASPAASTVTVLDCCHSGAFRGGELHVTATGSGRCVITSASATELAPDAHGPNGMSPFTNALVAGLRFAPTSGPLTVQALYEYVGTELSLPGNASPQYSFNGEGTIVLARKRTAVPAPVQALPVRTPPLTEPEPLELTLPEPRTRLWRLLNEAATATLSKSNADLALAATFCDILRDAVKLDAKWPEAMIRRLPEGLIRQMAVEALVQGLAAVDIGLADTYVQGLPEHTATHVGACLAFARAVADRDQRPARNAIRAAVKSGLSMPLGKRKMLTLLDLRQVFFESADTNDPHAPNFDSAFHRAAAKLLHSERSSLDDLVYGLGECIDSETDQAKKFELLATMGIARSAYDPHGASACFRIGNRFLPVSAFAEMKPGDIATSAAAMLDNYSDISDRLFEIAELNCGTQDDWSELFSLLLGLIQNPDQAPTSADHLLQAIERAGEHADDETLSQTTAIATTLAATAPAIAERLIDLDPDEDRVRRSLMNAAKAAATVHPAAARRMAAKAERLVSYLWDREQQAPELTFLVEAYAAVDPDHAIRLLRNVPSEDLWQSVAIEYAARAMAAAAPARIDDLFQAFTDGADADLNTAKIIEGVAEVEPLRAVSLARDLPDTSFKGAALAKAVETLIPESLPDAENVARDINNSHYGPQAVGAVAKAIATNDPDHAIELAALIPENDNGFDNRAAVFTAAARSVAAENPQTAEHYLRIAERNARAISASRLIKCLVFTDIGRAYSLFAPLRASHFLNEATELADAIPEEHRNFKESALAGIMVAWATVVPDHAYRIAKRLPEDWHRDSRIQEAVEAMAPIDPRRADQMAKLISDEATRLDTQSGLVQTFSRTSPAKAERLALAMPPGEHRARALLIVAEAFQRHRAGE